MEPLAHVLAFYARQNQIHPSNEIYNRLTYYFNKTTWG
jgi:hypothetical protein